MAHDEGAPDRLTSEVLFTSPAGFALATATPTQRAICRIADGLPLGRLAKDKDVVRAVGGEEAVAALPRVMPRELYVLAGIRSGKSLWASTLALRSSQICDLSRLRPGEVARISVLSTRVDLAGVIREHLVGALMSQPALTELLVKEPTDDTILVRHPTGRYVEIKIVAGARAGSSLVARWSAGAIFDEFPRMLGADDGVINFDDGRRAVLGRLLPGAQLIAIGSPWAPFGPAYRVACEHFGKPSAKVVVVRATGPMMNPSYWTPERCEELRKQDKIAYRTDVEGEFADAESALFDSDALESATRPYPVELPALPDVEYGAVMDPATRGNAWTLLVVMNSLVGGMPKLVVCLARQWVGSTDKPLSPDAVLKEIAGVLKPYRVSVVTTDQWAADALRDLGFRHGIVLRDIAITGPKKVELFDSLRVMLDDGRVEFPPLHEFGADMRRVRRVLSRDGISIHLPLTSDGRHCDYAAGAALAMDIAQHLPLALVEEAPKPDPDAADEDEKRMLRQAELDRRYTADPLDRMAMKLIGFDG